MLDRQIDKVGDKLPRGAPVAVGEAEQVNVQQLAVVVLQLMPHRLAVGGVDQVQKLELPQNLPVLPTVLCPGCPVGDVPHHREDLPPLCRRDFSPVKQAQLTFGNSLPLQKLRVRKGRRDGERPAVIGADLSSK